MLQARLLKSIILKDTETFKIKIEQAKNCWVEYCTERNFIMSSKFDAFLQEQLQDPEIRKEYEALQTEHTVIQAMIDAEQKSGMLPKELDS